MSKVLNVIRNLVCLILSIVLFLVLSFYLLLQISPKIINKENVTILISNMHIKDILGEEASDTIEKMHEIVAISGIDEKVVDEVLNSKEIKQILGQHFGNLVESILYNGQIKNITSNDLVDASKETINKNISNTGYNLNILEKAIILSVIESKSNDIIEIIPTYDDFTSELTNDTIETIQFVFGSGLKNLLFILLLITVILIIIFKWSIYRFAIWTGVTTAVVGLLFIALGEGFSATIIPELTKYYDSSVIEMMKTNVFEVINNIGLTTSVIGVIQIGYYFVIKKSNKNIRV